MIHDIVKLDRQIQFLENQASKLLANNQGAAWAQGIAKQFRDVKETLILIRREQQMTGLNGKRIE